MGWRETVSFSIQSPFPCSHPGFSLSKTTTQCVRWPWLTSICRVISSPAPLHKEEFLVRKWPSVRNTTGHNPPTRIESIIHDRRTVNSTLEKPAVRLLMAFTGPFLLQKWLAHLLLRFNLKQGNGRDRDLSYGSCQHWNGAEGRHVLSRAANSPASQPRLLHFGLSPTYTHQTPNLPHTDLPWVWSSVTYSLIN